MGKFNIYSYGTYGFDTMGDFNSLQNEARAVVQHAHRHAISAETEIKDTIEKAKVSINQNVDEAETKVVNKVDTSTTEIKTKIAENKSVIDEIWQKVRQKL
jgi:F0F1-type ATP synthase membrane subunit b/b'